MIRKLMLSVVLMSAFAQGSAAMAADGCRDGALTDPQPEQVMSPAQAKPAWLLDQACSSDNDCPYGTICYGGGCAITCTCDCHTDPSCGGGACICY